MVLNEADDIRLGSGKVDAVYLGDTLVWPQVAYTYVVISTTIHYSAGTNIDAGSVGSMYSGNYAYVTGTVQVKRDDTVVDTLYDEPLTIDYVSSDFAVINEKVYGYNLGKQVTSGMLTTDVYVSYRTSVSVLAGVVSQVRNTRSQTSQSIEREYGTPTVSPRPVAGSYYVVLNANRYTTSGSPCPAYGSYATLTLYGGHNEANYSTTPWEDVQTTIYTYTSGATDTEYDVVDSGYTTPEKQGSEWGVDDTPTLTENVSWASYDSTTKEVTIDNAGQTIYTQPRACLLTATNGDATATITLYQQANILESTTTTYDIYAHIVRSSAFPADGGTFPVYYHSRKTTTNVYTSGEPTSIASGVESYIAASPDNYVTVTDAQGNILNTVIGPLSGNGTAYLNIAPNTVGQRTITVYVTPIESPGAAQSDWRYQDVASFPQGEIYPDIVGASITLPIGAVRLHWKNTPNTTPTPTYPLTITFTNIKLHFIYDGSSTEYVAPPAGTDPAFVATFQRDDSNFYPDTSRQFIELAEGTSGECWFTADSTSGVIATFPHKTFTVPGGGGPSLEL